MAPVDFDQSCRSCHSLDFDRAVAQQAPHSTAANAFTFLRDAMAHAHHGDQAALVRAETILFRGKCSLCHQVTGAEALPNIPLDPSVSPVIAPARQPERFFPSAVFSHTTHSAVRCEECHQAALASTSGKDLLLPSITTCQRCHDGLSRPQGPALANGHAESGCVLCHVYHQPTSQSLAAAQPHPAYRIEDLVPHH
jgi:Zn finger protein HypA/HybF involved in hydrogenase expression